MKYVTYPLPVWNLTLSLIDQNGQLTGDCFSIYYHPIKNVHDFLILKQVFDKSLENRWTIGAKCRYHLLNARQTWKIGKIHAMVPFENEFPECCFRSYEIKLDDRTVEKLSPWDLEPADETGK